jgi:hypothetical protein
MSLNTFVSQNDLLLNNLLEFYKNEERMNLLLKIITGESKISLRIIDWFATNYAKKHGTVYNILSKTDDNGNCKRFKVYIDYKLKLKAYSKSNFDPFCRWERTIIPYKDGKLLETTVGQLNFFKWAIENKIIEYIEVNYDAIEKDMNMRNNTSKNKDMFDSSTTTCSSSKTRKKREEISISATKSIKKEDIEIVVKFN